jgi:hypothetical protein
VRWLGVLVPETAHNHRVHPTAGARHFAVNRNAVGGAPAAGDAERSADKRMKTQVLISVLCASVTCGLSGLRAQERSSWDDYIPRTLQSVIDQHAESARNTDSLYTGDNFPSRATVTYTGQKRALPAKRAEFLGTYFTKVLHQPQLAAYFKSEILVREGARELWVPIQESLLPSLSSEVAAGGQVTVLAIWLGAFRQGKSVEWVFAINEFEASGSG